MKDEKKEPIKEDQPKRGKQQVFKKRSGETVIKPEPPKTVAPTEE